MRSGAIDADMLAETARVNVGMYNENDVIISIDLTKLILISNKLINKFNIKYCLKTI